MSEHFPGSETEITPDQQREFLDKLNSFSGYLLPEDDLSSSARFIVDEHTISLREQQEIVKETPVQSMVTWSVAIELPAEVDHNTDLESIMTQTYSLRRISPGHRFISDYYQDIKTKRNDEENWKNAHSELDEISIAIGQAKEMGEDTEELMARGIEIMKRKQEMERIVGEYPNMFTGDRFDEVMMWLSKIDPQRHQV